MRCIFEGTCNSDTDCTIAGETCDATSKKCKCGTAESCKGKTNTPTCDAGNNQCVAAADPAACNTDADCTVTGEKCDGTSKKCMCGTAESCKGNTAMPTCNAGNNECVPGMLCINLRILND